MKKPHGLYDSTAYRTKEALRLLENFGLADIGSSQSPELHKKDLLKEASGTGERYLVLV